ncbi:MAG: tetratricopeptide repeat protein [Polyangiaceae bacterium]|nr:tetratricopeptide repeat protein [Polyangiaceae bacterium]
MPDLRSMAEAPLPMAREVVATPQRAKRLPPHERVTSTEFGKLDLPLAAPDADLPAPKYDETDLPSPKVPSRGASEAGAYDSDAFLPSPLNRPSRHSLHPVPAQSSFGLLSDVLDASAKPTMQTLSGGFLAPGVLRPPPAATIARAARPPTAPRAGELPIDMAVPEEAPDQSQPALVLASAVAPRPVLLPATIAASSPSIPPFPPRRPGRTLAIVAALVATVAVAALTPVGGKAWRAIEGAIAAGQGGRQGGSGERALREAFVTDRADASMLAFTGAEAAWVQAGRGADATTMLVYAGSLYGLRFGLDAALAARLQAAFERLPSGTRKEDAVARAAYAATVGRDFTRAKGVLRPILVAEGGRDVNVLALAGEAFLVGGEETQAVELWSALARLESSPRAHYGLARALASVERRAEADEHARQTLALARDHAGARVLLAQSAWRNGRHDDVALPYVLEVTQSPQVRAGAGAPELIDAYALLATIHQARGRVGAAERAWADALRVDDRSARARLGAGEVLYQMGRYPEALEHFEAARPAGEQSIEAGVGAAKTKLAMGRAREAYDLLRALARESEERGKTSPKLWTWLGRSELALGSDAAAETSFRRAIALASEGGEEPEAHAALAEIYEKKGQLRPALASWRRALELDTQRPEWHYRIGRLFSRVARPDDARTHLAAAVQGVADREPRPAWAADACLLLGNAERKAGHMSSASTHYRCATPK